MDIQTISSMDTVLSADCIDFCPVETFQHLLIVGTYEFEEKDCRRGRLYLLMEQDDHLTKLEQTEMSGILDIRWCVHEILGKVVLGLVDADGMFITYSLDDGKHLTEISRVKVCPDISLYLDWSTRLSANSAPSVIISDSKGFLTLYSFNETDVKQVQKFKAHQYEAWVTSFNYWNPDVIYSGGDDCKFLAFDTRSKKALFEISTHNAGVTSIHSSLCKEEIIFSGCYNGDLNTWDSRKMNSPLFQNNLGGGVWRLRFEPHRKSLIVASSMHNGFQLLEVDEKDKPSVIGIYSKHKSLAYGADWSWVERDSKSEHRVGSVSFYDHLMCLWQFDR